MKQVKKFNSSRKDGQPKLKAGEFGRFKTGQYKTPPGHSGFKSALRKVKIGAGQRGIIFTLSEQEFRDLVTANCHYCGMGPKLVSYCPKQRTEEAFERSKFTHNGIDRVDSAAGYIMSNCVPCCTMCNRAKNDKPLSEFLAYLAQVAKFLGGR